MKVIPSTKEMAKIYLTAEERTAGCCRACGIRFKIMPRRCPECKSGRLDSDADLNMLQLHLAKARIEIGRLTEERDDAYRRMAQAQGQLEMTLETGTTAYQSWRSANESMRRERDEANRQLAAVVEALERTGKWARLPDGYLMCRVCCTEMRCECEPGKHIPREGCSNCLGRSGSILADIPAAGERAEKLAVAWKRIDLAIRTGVDPATAEGPPGNAAFFTKDELIAYVGHEASDALREMEGK